MSEKCIIPAGVFYSNNNKHMYRWASQRMSGLVRHEIFFGTANRQKSIEYGLVVFIRPEDHNASSYGVHCINGHDFDDYLKKYGQYIAMQTYGWTTEDFTNLFGKNYL